MNDYTVTKRLLQKHLLGCWCTHVFLTSLFCTPQCCNTLGRQLTPFPKRKQHPLSVNRNNTLQHCQTPYPGSNNTLSTVPELNHSNVNTEVNNESESNTKSSKNRK